MAKKKILKSQFHGRSWSDYRVVTLPIKDLWASVPKADIHKGKPFYSRLIKDIGENGLHYPLLIVHATRGELMDRMKRCSDTFSELPFDPKKGNLNVRLYAIWGGSNRVRVAEELGFTHVDCVIVESFNRAFELQGDHRKAYAKKYYIPPMPKSLQVSLSDFNSIRTAFSGGLLKSKTPWGDAIPGLLDVLHQPDEQANDWINLAVCFEALGEHLYAAKAFLKAHELHHTRRSTFTNILRNLYFACDYDRLIDYIVYCKKHSVKLPGEFASNPFFAKLFAREPFRTLADPSKKVPMQGKHEVVDDQENDDSSVKHEELLKDESTLSILEHAAKKNPNDQEAWFNYGLSLKLQEQSEMAAEAFMRVQELNPQRDEVYPLIFKCLFRAEKKALLLDFARYCAELNPEIIVLFTKDPTYWELFKQDEFEQLKKSSVLRVRERGHVVKPDDTDESDVAHDDPCVVSVQDDDKTLMDEYGALLKDEALLPVLKDAVVKNPSDEIAWFNYGTSLQLLERYTEAVDALFRAQELNPDNEAVYPAIYGCLQSSGDFELLLNFARYCNAISPAINEAIAQTDSFSELFEREELKSLVGVAQC